MKYNKTNYFEQTKVTFEQVANIHSDNIFNGAFKHSKSYIKSNICRILKIDESEVKNLGTVFCYSFYFKWGEKLIRVSNHWGWVGGCYWPLKTFKKFGQKYKWDIGIASFKSFKQNNNLDPRHEE